MINLLPPDTKQAYRYAARNQRLLKWLAAFVVALVGLGVIGTYGLLTLRQSVASNTSQVTAAQAALQGQHLRQTETQVKDITNSLRLTVQVLSQEILFSKLLQQVGAAIPRGAVLTNLTISQLKGGINLTVSATDYTTATQAQVNLADPTNRIFTKADIQSINCNKSSSTANATYPCVTNIRALFANNNPFLFINQGHKR